MQSRHVVLDGQPNFRDLGGYKAADGRTVKWRQVFRSGELGKLKDADLKILEDLRVKGVVDLRSEEEISAFGTSRLPAGAKEMPLPISSGNLITGIMPALLGGDFSVVPPNLLEDINRRLVRKSREQFGALLQYIADPSHRPLVFHCTQGKDRTGLGAALILSALGVSWEVAVEDYLLSNELRHAENQKMLEMIGGMVARQRGVTPEEVDLTHIEALFYVRASSLNAAHDEMRKAHGGVEGFLIEALGCSEDDLARLRDELLE